MSFSNYPQGFLERLTAIATALGVPVPATGSVENYEQRSLQLLWLIEQAVSALGEGGGSVQWTDIVNRPTTFPPTLPIPWADVSSTPSTFPPTLPIPWNDVSGKPTMPRLFFDQNLEGIAGVDVNLSSYGITNPVRIGFDINIGYVGNIEPIFWMRLNEANGSNTYVSTHMAVDENVSSGVRAGALTTLGGILMPIEEHSGGDIAEAHCQGFIFANCGSPSIQCTTVRHLVELSACDLIHRGFKAFVALPITSIQFYAYRQTAPIGGFNFPAGSRIRLWNY